MSDSASEEESRYLGDIVEFIREEKLRKSSSDSESSCRSAINNIPNECSAENEESDSSSRENSTVLRTSEVGGKSSRGENTSGSSKDADSDDSSFEVIRPITRNRARILDDTSTSDSDSCKENVSEEVPATKTLTRIPRLICKVSLKKINLSVILARQNVVRNATDADVVQTEQTTCSVGAINANDEETDEENYLLDEENILKLFRSPINSDRDEGILSANADQKESRELPLSADPSGEKTDLPEQSQTSSTDPQPAPKSGSQPPSETTKVLIKRTESTSTSTVVRKPSFAGPAWKKNPSSIPRKHKPKPKSTDNPSTSQTTQQCNKPKILKNIPLKLPTHLVKPKPESTDNPSTSQTTQQCNKPKILKNIPLKLPTHLVKAAKPIPKVTNGTPESRQNAGGALISKTKTPLTTRNEHRAPPKSPIAVTAKAKHPVKTPGALEYRPPLTPSKTGIPQPMRRPSRPKEVRSSADSIRIPKEAQSLVCPGSFPSALSPSLPIKPLRQRCSPDIPQQSSSAASCRSPSPKTAALSKIPRATPSVLPENGAATSSRASNEESVSQTRKTDQSADEDARLKSKNGVKKISIEEYSSMMKLQEPICVIDWNHTSVPTVCPPEGMPETLFINWNHTSVPQDIKKDPFPDRQNEFHSSRNVEILFKRFKRQR